MADHPDRSTGLQVAWLALKAERADDALDAMMKVASMGVELTEPERITLDIACTRVIESKLSSWRVLKGVEESEGNALHSEWAKKYKENAGEDIVNICTHAESVLRGLITASASPESRVVFYTMIGNIFKFCVELKNGDEKARIIEKSLKGYESATEIADIELESTNFYGLRLARSHSIFHHSIANDPKRAFKIALSASTKALAELGYLDGDARPTVYRTVLKLVKSLAQFTAAAVEESGIEVSTPFGSPPTSSEGGFSNVSYGEMAHSDPSTTPDESEGGSSAVPWHNNRSVSSSSNSSNGSSPSINSSDGSWHSSSNDIASSRSEGGSASSRTEEGPSTSSGNNVEL